MNLLNKISIGLLVFLASVLSPTAKAATKLSNDSITIGLSFEMDSLHPMISGSGPS